MASDTHTTSKAGWHSPGRIEMERLREQADRLHQYYEIHSDIEGPVLDATLMADLAMQWWNWIANDKQDFALKTGTQFSLSDREQLITAFAFGNIWERLRQIDERMSADLSNEEAAQ